MAAARDPDPDVGDVAERRAWQGGTGVGGNHFFLSATHGSVPSIQQSALGLTARETDKGE